MKILFYFICGILYTEIILLGFSFLCLFVYWYCKFFAHIFDVLEIKNPIWIFYEFIKRKIDIWQQ